MFNENQSKVFKIKISYKTIGYYKRKGYKCEINDIIDVKMEDLPIRSSQMIEVFCDYCLLEKKNTIVKIRYSKYIENLKNNEKNCCNNCKYKKVEENTLRKYGVKNVSQLNDVKIKKEETCLKNHGVRVGLQLRDKIKKTNLDKYGVEHIVQSNDFKQKSKETCLEKYGVEYFLQSAIAKEKIKETNLEKYGVENVFQAEEIKQKIKETNLEKYGVCYPMQSEEIKEKSRQTCLNNYGVEYSSKNPEIREQQIKTWVENRYKNGITQSSTQQRYLKRLLNGKLNYPIDKVWLDIAFPNEMIYIEYDGSGHDLSVKLGGDRKTFEQGEKDRQYFLKNKGWKLIRIISKNDFLPLDDKIIKLVDFCKNYLNTNHSWIEIDIDKSEIRCSQFAEFTDLGKLRKIPKDY